MGKRRKLKQHKPKQVNQYDKIIKENIEAVIPSLMQDVFHITAIKSEELPDDIQHTKERKPDVLKKVTDEQGNTFILQVEFQVADEVEMIYRMAEYFVMLERRYKLPVRQFVIYLGRSAPAMLTHLNSPPLQFSFNLVSFTQLNYEDFLTSNKPQEVVLSVLANFKGSKKEVVLQQILARIEETTDSEFTLKRYVQQLRVLAQLRNLEKKLEKVMDSIAPYISEERDALYMRGVSKTKEELIINLVQQTDFTDAKIAALTKTTIVQVRRVRQRLTQQ